MRPGQIQVFDGLRLTTQHMDHLQGSLHSAIQDIREILGLGRVHSGFGVTAGEGDALTVQPGVAFDFQKNRIVLDEPKTLQVSFGPEQDVAYVCARYDQVEDGETEGRSTLIWDEAALEILSEPPTEEDNVVPLAKVTRAEDGSLQTSSLDEPPRIEAVPAAPPEKKPTVRQGVLHLPLNPAAGASSGAGLATKLRAAREAGAAADVCVIALTTEMLAPGFPIQSLSCHATLALKLELVDGTVKALRCCATGEMTYDGEQVSQFGASTCEGTNQLNEQDLACVPLDPPLPDQPQPLCFSLRIAAVTDAHAEIVCSLRCVDANEDLLRAIEEQWARLTWDIHLGWKALGNVFVATGRELAAPVA